MRKGYFHAVAGRAVVLAKLTLPRFGFGLGVVKQTTPEAQRITIFLEIPAGGSQGLVRITVAATGLARALDDL